jgi:ABC-type nitrate/sulfonate/bicarbonate transport system substrate-binding protein
MDRLRRSLGVSADAWQVVDVPSDAQTQAIISGGLDVVALSEPMLSRALDEGVVRIWRTNAEIYPFMQQFLLVFGPRLLDQDRELGARFLAAYLRAEREIAAGKTDVNVARMARALDVYPALARRICWTAVSADLGLNVESVAEFQRWAVEQRLLDRLVGPEEYWDGWFAARARRLAPADGAGE